jgi:hypothetical protein
MLLLTYVVDDVADDGFFMLVVFAEMVFVDAEVCYGLLIHLVCN